MRPPVGEPHKPRTGTPKRAPAHRQETQRGRDAHNLIRCVMAEAVARYAVDLERVSFKGSVDALRQYSAQMDKARSRELRRQLWADLLLNLARDLVRLRPNRTEPRAVKRRPKPYPLLNRPRRCFKEIPHRNRYWKGHPRNYRSFN